MIRLDDFMQETLTAYYNGRDPLGVEGDFTTAPEISQLFGEIIGIWVVQQWAKLDSPPSFNLIEVGPGRGTLMADLLRGTEHIAPMHNAMNIHMVETSSTLIKKQEESLKGHKVTWHKHLSELNDNSPSIIITNEFFDALPIQQFKYIDNKWHEHYIDDGKTTWIAIDKDMPSKLNMPTPKNGDIFEYSSAQEQYAQLMGTHAGAALIIDYGYLRTSYGDSLQALYKHGHCKITDHIGNADITSHVDFEWLSSFFNNTQMKTQSQFLQENGIAIRYNQLNNPSLRSGYERLIHSDQMGDLFKVLEVFNPGS